MGHQQRSQSCVAFEKRGPPFGTRFKSFLNS